MCKFSFMVCYMASHLSSHLSAENNILQALLWTAHCTRGLVALLTTVIVGGRFEELGTSVDLWNVPWEGNCYLCGLRLCGLSVLFRIVVQAQRRCTSLPCALLLVDRWATLPAVPTALGSVWCACRWCCTAKRHLSWSLRTACYSWNSYGAVREATYHPWILSFLFFLHFKETKV